MAVLYTNPKGEPVTTSSYSSNDLFKSCPRLYYLDKVVGWKRKDKSAALKFGRAFENGLQFYHDNGLKPDAGVDHFKFLWLAEKENTELKYTKAEVDWKSLYQAGAELLKLYEILLPSLPIRDPVFQANYKKTVFPGSDLADIQDQGYVDVVSRSPWVHPLLPKVDIPKGSPYRVLGIDIKTSGKSLDATPDLLTLDPQLLRYAWLSGILDWGFLWAVKSNPVSFQKGTEVTLLADSGKWKAGDKATISEYDSENQTALLGTEEDIAKVKETLDAIKGKGSTEAKNAAVAQFQTEGVLSRVSTEFFTKMKIQFVAVRMSEEDVKEAGDVVGHDIAGIVEANRTNFWPKHPGVRFPNTRCSFCAHRGICLHNDQLRDNLLVQLSPAAKEEDWLDDIGEDDVE